MWIVIGQSAQRLPQACPPDGLVIPGVNIADSILANPAALTRRINTELEAGRDRLLELHSHQPERAAAGPGPTFDEV